MNSTDVVEETQSSSLVEAANDLAENVSIPPTEEEEETEVIDSEVSMKQELTEVEPQPEIESPPDASSQLETEDQIDTNEEGMVESKAMVEENVPVSESQIEAKTEVDLENESENVVHGDPVDSVDVEHSEVTDFETCATSLVESIQPKVDEAQLSEKSERIINGDLNTENTDNDISSAALDDSERQVELKSNLDIVSDVSDVEEMTDTDALCESVVNNVADDIDGEANEENISEGGDSSPDILTEHSPIVAEDKTNDKLVETRTVDVSDIQTLGDQADGDVKEDQATNVCPVEEPSEATTDVVETVDLSEEIDMEPASGALLAEILKASEEVESSTNDMNSDVSEVDEVEANLEVVDETDACAASKPTTEKITTEESLSQIEQTNASLDTTKIEVTTENDQVADVAVPQNVDQTDNDIQENIEGPEPSGEATNAEEKIAESLEVGNEEDLKTCDEIPSEELLATATDSEVAAESKTDEVVQESADNADDGIVESENLTAEQDSEVCEPENQDDEIETGDDIEVAIMGSVEVVEEDVNAASTDQAETVEAQVKIEECEIEADCGELSTEVESATEQTQNDVVDDSKQKSADVTENFKAEVAQEPALGPSEAEPVEKCEVPEPSIDVCETDADTQEEQVVQESQQELVHSEPEATTNQTEVATEIKPTLEFDDTSNKSSPDDKTADSADPVDKESKPSAAQVPTDDVEQEMEQETESEVKSEINLENEQQMELEVEQQIEPEVEPEAEPEVEPEAEPAAELEVEQEAELEVEPEVEQEVVQEKNQGEEQEVELEDEQNVNHEVEHDKEVSEDDPETKVDPNAEATENDISSAAFDDSFALDQSVRNPSTREGQKR